MNDQAYFHGFLACASLLALQHITLYKLLGPWPLVKFILGTSAILAGCAIVAWETYQWDVFLVPLGCAASGMAVVGGGYGGRWLYNEIVKAAETRGFLKGLADKGDIAHERDGE